jgi:hypothetical protein
VIGLVSTGAGIGDCLDCGGVGGGDVFASFATVAAIRADAFCGAGFATAAGLLADGGGA